MTREARLMSGIILITIPTIQYGGYFLLTSLMSKSSGYMENALRQNFFRTGHAHAGAIAILALVCPVLADSAVLPSSLIWFVRIGVPVSAIFISAGFFFSMLPPAATEPSGAVKLIYAGCCFGRLDHHIGHRPNQECACCVEMLGIRKVNRHLRSWNGTFS